MSKSHKDVFREEYVDRRPNPKNVKKKRKFKQNNKDYMDLYKDYKENRDDRY